MDSLWQNLRGFMNKKIIKQAFISTIPVMLGYIFVAIAYALVMKEKGFGITYCLLMSIFVYAGAMQFAGVELLYTSANLIQVAFMTLMINIRHIFYGLSLMDEYKQMKHEKYYFIHSLSDETYSLLCINKNNDKRYILLVGLFNQSYWVIGTLIGCILSKMIPFDTTGIDFAMNALFIVVFMEQFLSSKDKTPSMIGLMMSLICLFVFGKDNMVFTSMILILISLLAYRKIGEKYE